MNYKDNNVELTSQCYFMFPEWFVGNLCILDSNEHNCLDCHYFYLLC